MKFNTSPSYLILWLCVVFLVNQVFSESVKKFADDVLFPVANILLPVLAIPPPAGPIIFSALGLMQICSNILGSGNTAVKPNEINVEKPLAKVDLMEVQSAIMDQVKTLDMHLLQESERIIRDLRTAIEEQGFIEEMYQTVDYLQQTFADRMKSIINPKSTGIQKRLFLQDMLSYSSDYRYKLRSFINKFIKSNNGILLLKRTKLFFEHILEKEHFLTAKDEDCNSDSFHNKIYKSFMYILKVLTEAYVMAVSAHVVKYQEELLSGTLSEAEELRDNAVSLINDYKNDAKKLIEHTKWALGNASREIRNCGNFKLEEGMTFERVSFTHMLPKILYLEYLDVFRYRCKSDERFVNITNYDIGACSANTDYIPFGSQLTLGLDLQKSTASDKSPYSYMKLKKPNGEETLFGHIDKRFSFLYSFKTHPECYTTFCPAYKKKSYAISTQRVSAEPGNVITGLRFRVKKKIIYIDIQQGKFIDLLSVDPKTVFWTETPESNQIAYLDSTLRNIELGDFVLKKNSILTSIQLRKTFFRKGLIRILIDGLTPPYMNNTDSVSYENDDLELNQLELINADDPAMGGDTSNQLITKPPVAGKRYYVSFQPSDFKKDFGKSTIPLLDIREVFSNPPAPLNGLGFYLQGRLVTLKLITPNLADLLSTLKEI